MAERYANSQSYRAFLAAQAETAIREAEAAADVAALSAQAVADAQYQLLDELDQLVLTPPKPDPVVAGSSAAQPEAPSAVAAEKAAQVSASGLTVWLYEADPVGPRTPQILAERPSKFAVSKCARRSRRPGAGRRDRVSPVAYLRRCPRTGRYPREPHRVSPPAGCGSQGPSAPG